MTDLELAQSLLKNLYEAAKRRGFSHVYDLESFRNETGPKDNYVLRKAAFLLKEKHLLKNLFLTMNNGVYASISDVGKKVIEKNLKIELF